jgi:hypothetical protein
VTYHEENKPVRAGGVHVMANAKLLAFLKGALTTIGEVWTDDVADKHPERILQRLEGVGWVRAKDSYGSKAIMSMSYPASTPPRETDEIRVTVILSKAGALKLDIRLWGTY